MRPEAVDLRIVSLPMATPFTAAHGSISTRTVVIIRVVHSDGEGWGECAALPEPTYTDEYVDDAFLTLRDHLVPALFATTGPVTADGLTDTLGAIQGHPMAKAAVELALLDLECRAAGTSLSRRLGPHPPGPSTNVPAGVALGLHDSPDDLAADVAARVAEGYGRIKMKIAPSRDIDFVRAARDAAGNDIALSVDANGSYRLDVAPGAPEDSRRLVALDEFALTYIEQPLAADNLLDHAELARRLSTPICLDESLTSTTVTREALDMGACSVVCVKAPRYGSWLDAASVLDHCDNNGIDAWVGGMLDAGIGRAANLALAAQPGASMPGDLAATSRFFTDDLCAPFTIDGPPGHGTMTVPDGPGLGIEIDTVAVERLTTRFETVRR
jgi:O-succinylbenzoate synthase